MPELTLRRINQDNLPALTEDQEALLRPHLFGVNVGLILLAIVGLIVGGNYGIKPEVVFMISFVLSMVINYPNVSTQKARVDAHAKSAILMASVLFAAGAFTGIMKGSGKGVRRNILKHRSVWRSTYLTTTPTPRSNG